MRIPRFIPFLLLFCSPVPAVPGYLPGQSDPSRFRLDLVALDRPAMRAVSRHLATLAQRPDATSPEELRATAQLLVLARRLDPGSTLPAELSRRFGTHSEPPLASRTELEQARASLLQTLRWLSSSGAGAESRKLATLILDPFRLIVPGTSFSGKRDLAGEPARWKSSVPPLASYKEALAKASVPEPAIPFPVSPDPPAPPAPPAPPDPETAAFRHFHLRLRSPLAVSSSTPGGFELLPIALRVARDSFQPKLDIAVSPPDAIPSYFRIGMLIKGSLATRFSRIPAKHTATLLLTKKLSRQTSSRNILAFPASLLFHAAFAKDAPHASLIPIGQLSSSGRLARPAHAWLLFRSLREVKNARILIPPGCRDDLLPFLASRQPEFFLLNEIFEVDSMETALLYATRENDPPPAASALRMFGEFRASTNLSAFRTLLTTATARARLRKIKAADPRFLCPGLLLLQGSRNCPRAYPRRATAEELHAAILPLRHIFLQGYPDFEHKKLEVLKKSFDEEIERITKNTAFADRKLLDLARPLRIHLRALIRESKSRYQYEKTIKRLRKAHAAFKQQYRTTRHALAQAMKTSSATP